MVWTESSQDRQSVCFAVHSMLPRVLLFVSVCCSSCCSCAYAAVAKDEILNFPGTTTPLPSRIYNGYLRGTVGNQTFYSHYTLTLSQRDPTRDPLVLWQQGSGSSFGIGFLTEVGPFRVDGASLAANASMPVPSRNAHSWDRESSLLLFEHPPGVGFSYCVDSADKRIPCHWDDSSQAVAFHNTLLSFYGAYPELGSLDLFIIGESYAGLYVPYAIREIMRHPGSVPERQLRSFAIGNGCTGTIGASPSHPGTCNGPGGPMGMPMARCGATEHVVNFLSAHAALSPARRLAINRACGFPCKVTSWGRECGNFTTQCVAQLKAAEEAVGDFYMYNYYDTCGDGNQAQSTGSGAQWNSSAADEWLSPIATGYMPGGSPYPCGTTQAVAAWCNNEEVRAALHMKPASFYGQQWNAEAFSNPGQMQYSTFSGCSFCLYPELLRRYNVVIYNGDFDTCVPWSQNEQWTSLMAAQEGYAVAMEWRPWPESKSVSGYVTTYAASKSTNLTFLTVKGAGHMVPTYQPEAAADFLRRFLGGQQFVGPL